MTTEFQKRLVEDKDTLWDIVKVFHPNIPEVIKTKNIGDLTVKDNRLAAGLRYDWVCIEFRVKDYGLVSIGIDNCCQYELFGSGITREQMRKALVNGTCSMRVWLFSLDRHYKSPDPLKEKLGTDAVTILKNKGYKLQTVDEMYKIYYED